MAEEVLNDRDSDDEDMLGLNDPDSDEDETESNQHHPLLSELMTVIANSSQPLAVQDDAVAEMATSAAMPCISRHSPCVIRGCVWVRCARSQGQTPVEGGMAGGERVVPGFTVFSVGVFTKL